MTDTPETNSEADEALEVSDLPTDANETDLPEAQDDDDDPADGEDNDDGDEGDDDDDGLVEMTWEGKTIRVPPDVKAGHLRQADYTRKTQALSEDKKALDAERQALTQQVATSKEIEESRVQYGVIVSQLKALDALDWDKLETEDPEEANRLFRQRQRIRDKQIDLAGEITQKQTALERDRQRSANEATAKAVRDTQEILQRDIKGWNEDLATKVGEFAVKSLGWTPQQVLRATDPVIIKTLHAAFVGDQAQRKLKQQNKLDAGDKTTPVSRPGGGGASQSSRRTTDATGDKLSTAEWMRREDQREAALRKSRGR